MRPSFRRWVAALLPLFLVIACSQTTSSASNKQLIIEKDFGTYDSLDPARGVFGIPILVDKNVYDTLLTIHPADLSKPYPSLATSFTESSDGKTFTFQLRHGAKFASGNPVTSADVVWSLTRLKNIKAGGAAIMNGLTVSASDASTVTITSDIPNPAIPIEMTQSNAGILDSKLVEQNGGTDTAADQADSYLNSYSAGSGPYMEKSVDRTSQIVLIANPLYWGPKPAYSTVILRNSPEATQRFDIQDGQAQLALDVTPQEAASMPSSVNVISAASLDQMHLDLNTSSKVSPLTANKDFRDAVFYGLDYAGLVALAGKGAIESTGFIPAGILGSLPRDSANQPVRDLARAQASLAKVGVANPTVVLRYYSNQVNDGLSYATFAQKIQSDLKEVGITVSIDAAPMAVLGGTLRAGLVQMYLHTSPSNYPDPADSLSVVPGPTGYLAKWQNWLIGMDPTLDSLVATASLATTPADRGPALQAVVKEANATHYSIYFVQVGRSMISAKSVHATLNPFDFVDLGLVS